MSEDVALLKQQGNDCFKAARYDQALERYTEALKLCADSEVSMKSTLLKNAVAVRLKLNDYLGAEKDATLALSLVGNDPKALYRRARAREHLHKYGEAITDARTALQYDPKNEAIVALLKALLEICEEKRTTASSCEAQVRRLLSSIGANDDGEKRSNAFNSLAAVCRKPFAAAELFRQDGHRVVVDAVRRENDVAALVAGYRCVAAMIHSDEQLKKLFEVLDSKAIVALLNHSDAGVVTASTSIVQRVLNVLIKGSPLDERRPDENVVKGNTLVLVDLLFEFKVALLDATVSALARNSVIGLLSKNLMHMDGGLPRGWSLKFVQSDGLERLLSVACSVPEQGSVPVNAETRDHLAICMSKLYEDMLADVNRNVYKEVVKKFVEDKVKQLNDEVKVEICSLAITMLKGPVDVAFSFISSPSYTDLLLEMADSENPLLKSIAAEAIVSTVSKRDRCTVFLTKGAPVLKRLFKSTEPIIRVKALLGLCKCASSGGNDVSLRPVEQRKMLRLAESCKRFLVGDFSTEIQRFAAEALVYLVLDADIKEWLISDVELIRTVVALAKKAGPVCSFAVGSIFVHLTNTYDKADVEPELVELAKYAKHHVPQRHPKDADSYAHRRSDVLVKEGATAALVALSDTTSAASRESIVRVLHGFCADASRVGVVVQEGGAKVLLKLAQCNNTDVGRKLAAHALAKICACMNPAIALPGQRCHEVIRVLIGLLHPENHGLECYEALLALTNLAAAEDSYRTTMLNANVVPAMEEFWFMQDDQMLRAAAAELYLNLLHCARAQRLVAAPGTDRLKLWLLYCKEEEDERLALAAVSALVILTADLATCRRIVAEVPCWLEVLQVACSRDRIELQRRGLLFALNMVKSCQEIAAQIVQSSLLETFIVIVKLDQSGQSEADRKVCAELANEILALTEKYELIKATDREIYERTTGKTTIAVP